MCRPVALIVFGVILSFVGFVMLMYGFIHKPFFSKKACFNTCTMREDELNRIKACKIIGPILFGVGLVLIFVGVYRRNKEIKARVKTGVATYGAGGVANTTSYPTTTAATASYPAQAGYPPQYSTPSYPPMHQAHVPPPQANYPPGAGVYQTQAPGYQQPPYPPAAGISYPQAQYPVKAGVPSEPPPAYDAATAPSAPLMNNGP